MSRFSTDQIFESQFSGHAYEPEHQRVNRNRPDTGMGSLFNAQMESDTFLGSFLSGVSFRDYEPDENFDPSLFLGTKSATAPSTVTQTIGLAEDDIAQLLGTQSKEEFDFYFNSHLRQIDNQRVMENSSFGANLVAGLATAAFDPFTYIPGFQLLKVAKAGKKGAAVFKGVANSSFVAGSTIAVSELMIHPTQSHRTFGDSASYVTAASVLGGVLGGIAPSAKGFFPQLAKDMNNDITNHSVSTRIGEMTELPEHLVVKESPPVMVGGTPKRPLEYDADSNTLFVDEVGLKAEYEAGRYADEQQMPVGGVLPKGAFKNFEEYRDFRMQHASYMLHKGKGENIGLLSDAHSDWIWQAISAIGRKDLIDANTTARPAVKRNAGLIDALTTKVTRAHETRDRIRADLASARAKTTANATESNAKAVSDLEAKLEFNAVAFGSAEDDLSFALRDADLANEPSFIQTLRTEVAQAIEVRGQLLDKLAKKKERAPSGLAPRTLNEIKMTDSIAELNLEIENLGLRLKQATEVHPDDAGRPYAVVESEADRHAGTGVQAVENGSLMDQTLDPMDSKLKENFGFNRISGMVSPIVKAAMSPFATGREIIQRLDIVPTFFRGNFNGQATPHAVTTKAAEWAARHTNAKIKVESMFKKMVGGGENKMTRKAFSKQVSRAMRSGDRSQIKEVAEAASYYRREIYDPMTDQALKMGLLDAEDILNFEGSYLPRLFNASTVNTDEFIDVLSAAIAKNRLDDEAAKLNALILDGGEFHAKILKESRETAMVVQGNILRFPDNRMDPTTLRDRSRNKARVLDDIPDNVLEDFIDNDIDNITSNFVRSLKGDIELVREFGDVNLKDQRLQIQAETAEMMKAAKTAKERKQIQDKAEEYLTTLNAILTGVRGLDGMSANPDGFYSRALVNTRNLSFITQSSKFLLSSLPELSHSVGYYGMGRVFRNQFMPLFRDMKGLRMSIKDAGDAGVGIDHALNGLIADRENLLQRSGGGRNALDNGLERASTMAANVSGLSYYTNAVARSGGVASQAFVVEIAAKIASGKKVKKSDMAKYLQLGMTEKHASTITELVEKFGEAQLTDSGFQFRFSGATEWTGGQKELAARGAFRNAMRTAHNLTVPIGRLGDRPLWSSTNMGKTLTQYMSFGFAATSRIAGMRLQSRDAAALNGTIAALALGAIAYSLKELASGRPLPDDNESFMRGSVDNSGIFGILSNGTSMLQRAYTGEGGIGSLVDGEAPTYYTASNLADAFLGPSFGTAGNLGDAAFNFLETGFTGKVHPRTIHAAHRIFPLQELPPVRSLFENIEKMFPEEPRQSIRADATQ